MPTWHLHPVNRLNIGHSPYPITQIDHFTKPITSQSLYIYIYISIDSCTQIGSYLRQTYIHKGIPLVNKFWIRRQITQFDRFSLNNWIFHHSKWDEGDEPKTNGCHSAYLPRILGHSITRGTKSKVTQKCVWAPFKNAPQSLFWRNQRLRLQNCVQIVMYFRYYLLG
jgi:hypothetical protein